MRSTIPSSLRLWVLLGATAGALLIVVLGVNLIYYSGHAWAQSTAAAPGTTIKVNTKGDGNKNGNCTLREAIEAANTNLKVDKCAAGSSTDRDAIHFALGKQATITLVSTLPTIKGDAGLTINGQKAKITVSGDNKVRVFELRSIGCEVSTTLNLNHLTVANGLGGLGGGIYNAGSLRVRNSTISNNTATFNGGGIYNSCQLIVKNSTFSDNSALEFRGGGILNFGNTTVINSTFSGNSAVAGGAIANDRGTVTLRNTVLASSTSGGNCAGVIYDEGYNIEDASGPPGNPALVCSFDEATSLTDTNPLLASSLANNGGPTKTIALLKGSPAINSIPKATNGCGTEVTTDQRGVMRPQGKGCDIGAFEKKVVRHR